ncbi:MAG: hypothetical protein AAF629_19425 [Chloroflexota bacterium]
MTISNSPEAPTDNNGKLVCPKCSHPNTAWRSQCEQCREPLRPGVVPIYATPKNKIVSDKRPGCLTAYLIILIIASLLAIPLSLILIDDYDLRGWIMLPAAIINIVLVWGLWRLREWARILFIVLTGISTAIGVLSLLVLGNYGVIIGIVINIVLIRWFWNNDYYFS